MGAEKGDDKDLIFQSEASQIGQRELAFDRDLFFVDLDALDDQRRSLGDTKQVLPVRNGIGVVGHERKRVFDRWKDGN